MAGRWAEPLTVGSLRLPNRLALAPLAGTSETVYRKICHDFGAGLVVSELISARGIVYDAELTKNYRYLEVHPEESPVALQLFGSEPADFAEAIPRILEDPRFAFVDAIDLNMGCPVPKVVKQGSGSALMLDLPRAEAIAQAAVKACAAYAKSCTAKIRTGWAAGQENCVELAKRLEGAGIAMIAVHGRTREQFYSGQADWSQIAKVVAAVRVPVWGNGDLATAADCSKRWQETGVAGLMIGRAAQGQPWLFRELLRAAATADPASYQAERPTAALWRQTVLTHLDGLCRRLGEETGIREFRTLLSSYIKGLPGATAWRRELMTLSVRDKLEALIVQVAETLV